MSAVILVVPLVALYFLPTLIAAARHKANQGQVLVVNLFLGWSLIGWVVALTMAVGANVPAGQVTSQLLSTALELEKLADLEESGILSTKEYVKAKAKLLR
jgi:hypothetical protein